MHSVCNVDSTDGMLRRSTRCNIEDALVHALGANNAIQHTTPSEGTIEASSNLLGTMDGFACALAHAIVARQKLRILSFLDCRQLG